MSREWKTLSRFGSQPRAWAFAPAFCDQVATWPRRYRIPSSRRRDMAAATIVPDALRHPKAVRLGGLSERLPRHVVNRTRQWYQSVMPARLTPEQVAQLERSGGSPFEMENPQTRQRYVLVPREAYLQTKPLFEAIVGHSPASPPSSAQEHVTAVDWNDSKNDRRCALIDRKHDVGLSPAEETELDTLQGEFAAHQRRVAPRPLAILELLEEAFRQRTADSCGQAR